MRLKQPTSAHLAWLNTAEYILVLQPHEALENKVLQVRQSFREKFDTIHLGNRVNLTLVRFKTWQQMEERLIHRLDLTAMAFPPFRVYFKNYEALPAHTIFIHVPFTEGLRQLQNKLRSAARLMKTPDYTPYFIQEPHIPIARRMNPQQFETAWKKYSTKSFNSSFIAESMLLLKREQTDKAWKIVHRFAFMNLPVETVQGNLF